MSAKTGWGVWLHAVRPADELANLAAAAEDLGATAVLVADEGTDRDLHVTLATLALRTRRVLLVGAVTNPFSRHPVATAAAFAALGELAPGRIVAGFGAGGSRVFGPMRLKPRRPFTALVECVDVVQALWRGEVVDHTGEFDVDGASLPWSPGPLQLAIAGRGPRVERFAAERADWILLAGRAISRVAPLVTELRAVGVRTRNHAASIAWNPTAAWTAPMVDQIRAHFAYMVVDMPAADRTALGFEDDRIAQLKERVNSHNLEAAAALIPDTVLDRFAVTGSRAQVVARLAELRHAVQPEIVLFDADDYSVAFLEQVAGVARDAGAVAHNGDAQDHAVDSYRRA
jgi:alkanesulfonate monooxygenase SsuD/methylene tetrahydromethanopterin reductase-like flavin-dependent oxidoreductase (luciferase family)